VSGSRRRCRRVVSDDGLRPSDVLAAFFSLGIAFLLAAALAGVAYGVLDWAPGRWLALHLAFVGGVSQLVVGASQFFAGAFLATTPPPRRLVRAQLVAWNLGAVLVAYGVSARVTVLADAGAASLVLGLALLAVGLRTMQRRSLQRAVWATRWYYACAAFLAVGTVAGAALARGVAWTAGDLLAAHLAVNLGGWFGTAIVGTLHTFYPSLTQTRLRLPRLQPVTFGAWVGGVILLAAGLGFDEQPLVVAGWAALTAAALLLTVNLLLSTRAAPEPLSLPARLIAIAQVSWVVGLVIGLVAVASGDVPLGIGAPDRELLAILLLAGWLGLTVVGSLLHLLAVLVRVRNLHRPFPGVAQRGRTVIPAAAAVAVAGLAIGRAVELDPLTVVASVGLGATYAVLGTRVVRLAVQARADILPTGSVKKGAAPWPT
jgi:hypothetical protein